MITNIWLGLMMGVSEETLLKVLMSTGKSTGLKAAYRRFKLNVLHNQLWMMHELKPGSKAWESIKLVRKIHLNKTRSSKKAGVGIISQKDMVLIQLSSVGTDMTKSRKNGCFGTDEDFECYNHLWRVIGHLLGIQEKFNVCGESAEITKERIEGIKKEIFIPTFKNLPKDYEAYTRNATNGAFYFNPFLVNYEIIVFLMKRWLGLPNYYYFDSERISKDDSNVETLKEIPWYYRIFLFWLLFTTEIWNQYWILRLMSTIYVVTISILWSSVPIPAILRFGYKDGIVKI